MIFKLSILTAILFLQDVDPTSLLGYKIPVWGVLVYYVISAGIGALEAPDSTSGKGYRWFFKFANMVAANFSRAAQSHALLPKPPAPPGG